MSFKTSIFINERKASILRSPPRRAVNAIDNVIERYFYLIESEKKKVQSAFTTQEWKFLKYLCADSVSFNEETSYCSSELPPDSIRSFIENKLQDSTSEEQKKYSINGEEIKGKISKLSVLQKYTLMELLETMIEGDFLTSTANKKK